MAENNIQDSIKTELLCKEYDWYSKTVPEIVQNVCNEFFDERFMAKLIGVSQNMNSLLDKESCFVTKVRIDTEYDMFIRLTDHALDIIFEQVLGQSKSKFNINKITDLEAKIVTTFNDFMYNHVKSLFQSAETAELRRTNFDIVHMTFMLKALDENVVKTGKIVISLPKALIHPQIIESTGDKFSETNFPASKAIAQMLVAKNRFPISDIQNLEVDDVVVFDNSDLRSMQLSINGVVLPVILNPNMDILIADYEDDGGDIIMEETSKNLWDSIEVEMNAEFDTVQITLGELKNIEEGKVVDLTSLYENNVTLKVENQAIATGSLVIVNDRYGVKINNVIVEAPPKYAQPSEEGDESGEGVTGEVGENAEGGEEEFDYSDFDLEDDV